MNNLNKLYISKNLEYSSNIRKEILDVIPKFSKRILDLGCGNGIVIQKILDKLNSSEIRKDINIHLIDIDQRCIDQTLKSLKKVSSSNITVSFELASVFEKDPRELSFSFVYVFWRKSDVDNFPWKKISPGRIVSYKHEIEVLKKKLSQVVKSNSEWSEYENLFVYDY